MTVHHPSRPGPTGPGAGGESAISIAEALAAASQAHRDTTRLIRMLTVLGEPGDIGTLLDRALYTLSDLFDTDAVVALVPAERGHFRLQAECGLGEDLAAAVPVWRSSPSLARAAETLLPVTAVAGDPALPDELTELAIREVIWLPAGSTEDVTILGLLRCNDRPLDNSALEVLRSIGQRLGVALETARHQYRIEQLGRLGHAVSASLQPENVLQQATDVLPIIFGADTAAVGILQEDGSIRFADDYGTPHIAGHTRPAEELAAWPWIQRGEAFLAGPRDADIRSRWGEEDFTSVLGVPIPGKEKLIGILYLIRTGGQPFSTAARDALMLFSAQLGAALANAWLYSALQESQEELQLMTNSISDLVAVVGADGRCLYASPSHRRELGLDPAELIGASLADLAHPDDRDRVVAGLAATAIGGATGKPVEYRFQVVPGRYVWLETAATRLLDPAGERGDPSPSGRLVLSSRLVSERKQLEEQLRHAATTDELTGLANRRCLLELLDAALGDDTDRGLALLFLDLDRFKAVNDALGHAAGDQLLVEVARRLRACSSSTSGATSTSSSTGRSGNVLARLGGDEFVLLLHDLDPRDAATEADRAAERIFDALREPLRIGDRLFEVTASVGIVLPEPAAGVVAHQVLRDADTAMYQAKARGRARAATFDADLDRSLRGRLDLAADLRGAADRGELHLHYQPVVDADATVVGVEALLRWSHPVRGDVPPLDIIPLAEEMGILGGIGAWVLATACRQAAAWNALRAAAGLAPLRMAVNLSPSQIDDELVQLVAATLHQSGLAPQHLLLEVTETAYLAPASAAPQVLARLRALGVGVAIDDFGTGFSSFDRLRQFPADVLKIDRSFVVALDGGPAAVAIVKAMIDLARALGSDVVAEGVEQTDQADALLDVGCEAFQGWLYARALPANELAALVLDGPGKLDGAGKRGGPLPAPAPAIPATRETPENPAVGEYRSR